MRMDERQRLHEEGRKRFMSMLERLSQVHELVPWLRPGQSHSDLRRTADRLRSGVIRGLDPRVPPAAIADAIDASVAQEHLVRSLAMDMIGYRRMWEELREREEAERVRQMVEGFHRLKKAPEARDPQSPVAEQVRTIHRARRSEHGRPRRRKKKEKG
jgi:hypothetical protein